MCAEEWVRSEPLLREAERLLGDRSNGLLDSVPTRPNFATGAAWMLRALEVVRGQSLPGLGRGNYHLLGLLKYGLAGLAALLCVAKGYALLAPVAFYAVEAQFVFLFPLALDGARLPVLKSPGLTRKAGGTLRVMGTVMPIAWRMLSGVFRRAGVVESWCVGCLAVVLWYEQVRQQPRRPGLLEVSARGPLTVRRESVPLGLGLRLLYISDLHLRRGSPLWLEEQVLSVALSERPDRILLGGDLVDTRGGLGRLAGLVGRLSQLAPVGAVPGNHDRFVGLDRIRPCVLSAGGSWLDQLGDGVLSGCLSDEPVVLCAHDPEVFESLPAPVRLVLAGHLHGGQVVLGRHGGRLYPAAWFYRWNGLRFERDGVTMLVSLGVTDTVPVRWNCPREVLVVEV